MAEYAIELKNITKTFGKVVANSKVNLNVKYGEILALLGENGSGKTTLMNMISGIYFPDKGNIYIDGEEVVIKTPKDAFKYGIGMIHQHFKLVDIFSAAENYFVSGVDITYIARFIDLAFTERIFKEDLISQFFIAGITLTDIRSADTNFSRHTFWNGPHIVVEYENIGVVYRLSDRKMHITNCKQILCFPIPLFGFFL